MGESHVEKRNWNGQDAYRRHKWLSIIRQEVVVVVIIAFSVIQRLTGAVVYYKDIAKADKLFK